MNQDLTQKWLAEIQNLQQQMAELQHKRDELWESSQKWRQVYNTESEQRRGDAKIYEQEIASLKAEVQKLKGIHTDVITDIITDTIKETVTDTNNNNNIIGIELELSGITSLEEIKAKLIIVTQERDRLIKALRRERENHKQTRINLTTALGDAIDSLTQLRAATKAAGEGGEDKSVNTEK